MKQSTTQGMYMLQVVNGKQVTIPVSSSALPTLKSWTLSHRWSIPDNGGKAIPDLCNNPNCSVCN